MDTDKIADWLESLFERIEKDATTGVFKLGTISSKERDALKIAIAVLRDPGYTVANDESSNKTEPSKTETPLVVMPDISREPATKRPTKPVFLNMRSLEFTNPENPEVILCLDFGTAMSKAWAMTQDGKILDLALGRLSGKGVYPVDSSLFITQDGIIYFGPQAIDQSFKVGPHRQRFDSPKSYLNIGSQGYIDQHFVDKAINPTETDISGGDLIRLYLAYLTDLACSALEEKGLSRYTIRRFARPCWEEERKRWAEPLQKSLLAQAQILADTFHGRWLDGIPLNEANEALAQIRELPLERHFPEYLIDRGIPEPVAAAASLMIKDEPQRKLFMVMDVGAGTTDFGLFLMQENPDRGVCSIRIIPGTIQYLQQAGNRVDDYLKKYILEHDAVYLDTNDGRHIASELQKRIKLYKEELFRNGVLEYTLSNQTRNSIELKDFLKDNLVESFQKQIEDKFKSILENLKPGYWNLLVRDQARQGQNGRLPVVLTGGGATLPMVERVAQGRFNVNGKTIICEPKPLAPDWVTSNKSLNESLSPQYPQLAVAIGGANPLLPDEGQAFEDFAG